MSHSPTENNPGKRAEYQLSWKAIHRMLREGLSWSGRETHCAFVNLDGKSFATASAASGLDFPDDGRAAACIDWDGDGAPDLALTSRQAPRVRLMRHRNVAGARWLALRAEGTSANKDGIGARIEVELAGGARLIDSVRAGEGYLAQSSKWVHFGLGRDGEVARVRVRWPGARELELFEGVGGPGRWRLVQGEGRARADARAPALAKLPEAAVAAPPSTEKARISLAARLPLPPDLAWQPTTGGFAPLRPSGGPRLVVLWANWCAPCGTELRALGQERARLEAAGLELLALDADPTRSGDLLERARWPFPRGVAPELLLDALDVLQRALLDRQRPLALPTAFLIDARGELAVIYRGAVEVDQLLQDVARLESSPQTVLAAATPFAGVWIAPAPKPDFASIAALAAERGLGELQAFYQMAQMELRQSSPAMVAVRMGAARANAGRMEEAADLFAQAAQAEPGLAEAWRNLGAAQHSLGRLPAAIEAYRRALDLDGAHAETLHNLALARLLAGDEIGAARELELLRAFDPTAAEALAAALERTRAQLREAR